MRSEEEKIKEQRTVEAIKKDYMGRGGKIGAVLFTYGQPIKANQSPYLDQSYLDDPWELPNDEWHDGELQLEDIPELDEDELSTTVGYIFDGLRWGMHMEILYKDFKLSVHWKGRPVYIEESGDLKCFFPNEEWESKIEALYKHASKEKRQTVKGRKEIAKEQGERAKQTWLRQMWEKWGFQ